jgi:hypothetical protein
MRHSSLEAALKPTLWTLASVFPGNGALAISFASEYASALILVSSPEKGPAA